MPNPYCVDLSCGHYGLDRRFQAKPVAQIILHRWEYLDTGGCAINKYYVFNKKDIRPLIAEHLKDPRSQRLLIFYDNKYFIADRDGIRRFYNDHFLKKYVTNP